MTTDTIPHGYKEVRVPWAKATRRECGAFLVADVIGAMTSTAVMSIDDRKGKFKPALDKASKHLAESLFLPNLDWFEHFLGTVCKLEACKPDYSKSREERAETLARTSIRFTTAFSASMALKLVSREALNNALGIVDGKPHLGINATLGEKTIDHLKFWNHITKRSLCIFAADEMLHLGSMLMMTTKGAKHTDHMIHSTSNILQKTLGWSKKRADDAASTVWIYEVPNVIGAVAASGVIAGSHRNGWLVKDKPLIDANGERWSKVFQKLDKDGHVPGLN